MHCNLKAPSLRRFLALITRPVTRFITTTMGKYKYTSATSTESSCTHTHFSAIWRSAAQLYIATFSHLKLGQMAKSRYNSAADHQIAIKYVWVHDGFAEVAEVYL